MIEFVNHPPGTRILGIDEAGRGAVIGPMVICGILCEEKELHRLEIVGIKDSKRLAPHRRQQIAEELGCIFRDVTYIIVTPRDIDRAVRTHDLNVLEAREMAALVTAFRPDIAYIDAVGQMRPDTSISPQGTRSFMSILRHLVPSDTTLIAENDADEKYPIVGAASILAKVTRDELIVSLHEKYGEDFGSGYPDKKTAAFLVRYYKTHKRFPEDMRMNWKTRGKLITLLTQRHLEEFVEEQEEGDHQ